MAERFWSKAPLTNNLADDVCGKGPSDALNGNKTKSICFLMPGNLKGADLENFVRDAVITHSHETCTARMGRDPMAVVDSDLKVYGIDNLRIADGSTMPHAVLAVRWGLTSSSASGQVKY
jgi:choline dehydrogenase-like flavoprotein